MRIAVLSDIHGNREAFSAVLSDLQTRAADRIVLLGDLVGYGPDPEWCVDQATFLVQSGGLCVKGNHDSAMSNPLESMNPVARAVIDWTRPRLTTAQLSFLAALPLTVTLQDALFVHASVNSPADWSYVTSDTRATPSFRACSARVICCGHVHIPALMSCDTAGIVRQHQIPMAQPIPLLRSRRWLAVVGSVGQPRDGLPQAGYALLDLARNDLTFRRVAYDHATTVRKLRQAGLPETLALRLMQGA